MRVLGLVNPGVANRDLTEIKGLIADRRLVGKYRLLGTIHYYLKVVENRRRPRYALINEKV